jgi:hypothetical protein
LFRLLYGAEAMCPEELDNESARVLVGSSSESEEVDKYLVEIDMLDSSGDSKNLLKYQEETRKWRNKNVSLKNIEVGDYVLQRKKNDNTVGKFQFAWEGPYVVSSSVRDGAFCLKDETSVELPHS